MDVSRDDLATSPSSPFAEITGGLFGWARSRAAFTRHFALICDNYNAQSKGANRREEALVNGGEERVLWLFRFPFFRGWIGNIGNNVESKIVVFERERESIQME